MRKNLVEVDQALLIQNYHMPKITPMGVMNITPNSFSDGNSLLEPDALKRKWDELLQWARIIDIGAESTAPFNPAITEAEEKRRWDEFFFKHMDGLEFPKYLSVDTYKIQVFKYVYERFQSLDIDTHLIFNDISGSLDQELLDLLASKKEFSYVFCHNLAPTRQQASSHMEFLTTDSITDSVMEHFDRICSYNFSRRIYLDPCFGFSKTREQNHQLLKDFSRILNRYDHPLVFGVSRKSFLRVNPKMDPKDEQTRQYLGAMEALLLNQIYQLPTEKEIVLRTHGPESLQAVEFFRAIIS